uniref:Rho GTPase activating protein 22 n=1 Tax=Myripristis murdjan TaxID=586833 RepID=A0A667YP76_9TELE
MASSQSDMEEWVRAIRRAIWAPLGGGKNLRAVCCVVTGVFGQHLEETMLCENQCGPQRPVPVLVEQCVCFIRQRGLEEEGLFRAPGQTNHVRELQDAFDRGEKPVLDSTTDVHTVASLLKLYIRELPEPVIPFSKYTQFLSCAQLLLKDKEMGIVELGKQVKALPQVNYNLLKYICKFLDEVQSHSNENKMSVQNLATVFGPNILRPRVEDPVTMMEGSSHVQHLMTVLISEHARLYQREEPETETKTATQLPQSPGQRCKVEWVSQEDSKQFEPSPHRKSEGKAGSGAALSPSKQSKALPSWRCSFKGGAGSGGTRGKMGGSAGDVSTAGGSNWLMNGLSSLRAHRRTTSSGERLKDSTLSLKESTLSLKETSLTLKDSHRDSTEDPSHSSTNALLSHRALLQSHRLSAYDNVTVAPSSLSLPMVSEQGQDKPTEATDSINALDHSANSAGTGSETEPGDDTNLVTELKQELKIQRMSYETCICKLEESCSKYQSRVSRLEEELDQEKKKFQMLEIRLRNSERAHQDAENRNVLLQKEMEEFFKTLGDLTTGTARTD